ADTEAFREWSALTSAVVERRIGNAWTVSGGLSFEVADIREPEQSRRSYLVGLPLTVAWSTTGSDSLLDPTDGWRVSLATTPFIGSFDGFAKFLRSEAEASAYFPLDAAARTVLAARLKAGSIVGST